MDIRKLLLKQKNLDILSNLPDSVMFVMDSAQVVWANDVACEVFEFVNPIEMNITINDLIENGMELVISSYQNKKALIAKSTIKEEYYELTSKYTDDGYVIALRDSTQNYKRISGILAEKESSSHVTKDKNEFLVKLAYKFNPPLQSITGFAQGLIDGIGGEVSIKQDKYLNIIKSNSNELTYFFNRLVELSQSEANLFEKDIKYFDIVNLIEQTIKSIKAEYEKYSINIGFNVATEFKKMIYQDEPMLKIIMKNLLETIVREIEVGNLQINLTDTTEEFLSARNLPVVPSILITFYSSNLQITDNELPILFNPYAIIDKLNRNTITRAITLGTVKNLTQSIEGVIWVENVPMQGPVFNVVIPREKNINE